VINQGNYYSNEMNRHYFSVSQFNSFTRCESATMAELRGDYRREVSDAMLAGQMTAAWCEGALAFNAWMEENKSTVLNKSGKPYKAFEDVYRMIEALQGDRLCMEYLGGRKEEIFTATLFGAPWKIKVDVIDDANERIVDLKTTRSIHAYEWVESLGKKGTFIDQYSYHRQLAIYAEVHGRAVGSNNIYSKYIVAVSKEDPCDLEVIDMTDMDRHESELESVRILMPRFIAVKNGEIEPDRCGRCEWCRGTKECKEPIPYSMLGAL
jgi:hypothetical protein